MPHLNFIVLFFALLQVSKELLVKGRRHWPKQEAIRENTQLASYYSERFYKSAIAVYCLGVLSE